MKTDDTHCFPSAVGGLLWWMNQSGKEYVAGVPLLVLIPVSVPGAQCISRSQNQKAAL